MGLFSIFGKRKNGATALDSKEMYFVECGPACGFRVQSHNRPELVPMTQHHLKASHKTNLTEAEAGASINKG